MSTLFDHTARNQRAWNEIAAVRHTQLARLPGEMLLLVRKDHA